MRRVAALLALMSGCTCVAVDAGPIIPASQSFGELGAATFGGTGIPNNAVAFTTIPRLPPDREVDITIGLTAHERYFNPPLTVVTDNIFAALPGANTGGPGSPSAVVGALWNIGFYVQLASGGAVGDFQFDLLYDFDPAPNTDESAHGVLNLTNAFIALGGNPLASLIEGSENMNFGFLAGPPVPGILLPPPGSFDPTLEGKYTFALVARDAAGVEFGRVAILVDTTSAAARAVPEPASLLVFAGLAGVVLGSGSRRQKFRTLLR